MNRRDTCSSRLVGTFLLVGVLAVTLAACPDTVASKDDFIERTSPFRTVVAPIECDGLVDITGDYLVGITVAINPAIPVTFDASVDADVANKSIEVSMQILTVDGRDAIGEVYTANGALTDDGVFDLDFGAITIPPTANPIVPGVPAAANMQLIGCTRRADFGCGIVGGAVTSPSNIPLTGSTFGLVPLDGTETLADVVAVASCEDDNAT